MRIGIPKEIKANEHRVAITPAGVKAFVDAGHEVYIETDAGAGSMISDTDFTNAGAQLLPSGKEVWDIADMVLKVKEPLPLEYDYFRPGLILFTYLHLAAEPKLAEALLEKEVIGIAYETLEKEDGSLPLLAPMSEVAGRMGTQIGASLLSKHFGGGGILLGGVPGVPQSNVTIIGGGVVGINSAKIAVGLGAKVTILDNNVDRLRYLDDIFGHSITTLMSNEHNLAEAVQNSDLLIGAVLVPGAKAPKLVTEDMVKTMRNGSVIVDIAIDQGGSVETIDRVTTHENPTYVKHGVVHYSVANIPGSVPRTSTYALTNVTIPYALELAGKGWVKSCQESKVLARGVNSAEGYCTYAAVAEAVGTTYRPVEKVLGE